MTSVTPVLTTNARTTVASECTNVNLDKRVCKLENEVFNQILNTLEVLQKGFEELSKRPCACS